MGIKGVLKMSNWQKFAKKNIYGQPEWIVKVNLNSYELVKSSEKN